MLLLDTLTVDFCRDKAVEGLEYQRKLSPMSQLEISVLHLLIIWVNTVFVYSLWT